MEEDTGLTSLLYVGSAWSASSSVSGWMACQLAEHEVEVRSILLSSTATKHELEAASPSGRVPVLVHEGRKIWDSLAIAEYLWERNPSSPIWPTDPERRWYARCIAAEVHSHFDEVRRAMPMNLIKRWPISNGLPDINAHLGFSGITGGAEGVRRGLRRMENIWSDCRALHGSGGPYLFGETYNFVDASFAPMVSRYVTYGMESGPDATAYIEANMSSPLMQGWIARANADADRVGREVAMAFP